MPIDRRHLLVGSLTSATVFVAPLSAYGLDAAQFGVRPGPTIDQSRALQRAIDQAAATRAPLVLAPGTYRAGDLRLTAGTQILGVRGATRITWSGGSSLFTADSADNITLTGLALDGGGQPLQQGRGLVHFTSSKAVRIADCSIERVGGNAIVLERCNGQVSGNVIDGTADNALYCNDSTSLVIASNTIRNSGNGGIRVWQSAKRHDGSLIADNTIEDTDARSGGTGENGNAINVFRAADVIVRNNMIRRAAFSAIRGNAASNIQIIGNNCAELNETAMYAEFGFEGAIVANNIIEAAENGIAITNFDNGGRIATVHGNLLRNFGPRRSGSAPEGAGIGIAVEADTAVTGNVVENASNAGIRAGWGPYLRNVTVGSNVVRNAGYGIAVSVVSGAGDAAITGNVIDAASLGAIVGMEWAKAVTNDLVKEGAERFSQLTISGNHAH
jgi:uncharacterized secreted repeat protein (TIGR03808 family)